MIIDVMVNSCARPDILEVSLSTFKEKIKTGHELRYVLVEDKVDDEERQRIGAEWIEQHENLFDEVVFLENKAGPGYWYAPTIRLCRSDYHFHLEDDNEFIVDIYLDPIIEMLQSHTKAVEVIMSRGPLHKNLNPRQVVIDGLEMTEMDLYSVSTGVFNTRLVKALIDSIGWDKRLHEARTLTPMSKKMGLRKFYLGHNVKHYVHVGELRGFVKGSYK